MEVLVDIDSMCALELKLHSPAGAEPVLYTWPLTSGRGNVRSSTITLPYYIFLFIIFNIKTKRIVLFYEKHEI